MSHGELLYDILILLLAAVAVVPVLHRFGIPPVLGYLAAGVALGPYTPGPVVDSETTRPLAEFGVVFLLFTVGLELPLARLRTMRRYILGVGLTQVAATTVVLAGAAILVGLAPEKAFLTGVTMALSSTAMAVALLVERGETVSHHGRVAVAVLILQDLVVIPLMALLPLLAHPGHSVLPALGMAAAKAVVAVVVILVAGRLVLRPVLGFVASARGAEEFTAATLLLVLAVAWLTDLAGMSMALGAFLAGLMLADSPYRHQVEADIEPFKGLLLGLFFMTVGMSINLPFLTGQVGTILGLTIAMMAVKAALIVGLGRLVGLGMSDGLKVGFLLAQTGEFAFVVIEQAMAGRLMGFELGQTLLAVTALSMVLTPGVAAAGRKVAADMGREAAKAPPMDPVAVAGGGHVIIAGYGRMGRVIGRLLARHHIAFVALDQDADQVANARREGLPVFFGDASVPGVLRSVGIDSARAVVVTVGAPRQTEKTIAAVRRAVPQMTVIARAKDRIHEDDLIRMGVTVVVPEAVEASLQMAGEALRAAGVGDEDAKASLTAYRDNRYDRRRRRADDKK